ncbi:MAG: leucyl/phenylalanyl-tRNA--protein transferase [Desulfovibrio sp.]|nr:leucyl/phenylalanyl-tRNA--protein transferase [Desulfovibrio sp.]
MTYQKGGVLESSEESLDEARIFAFRGAFPPTRRARRDGLLCLGGDLSPERLLAAYSLGIFPWFSEGSPLLWWTLAPRCVMPLEAFALPPRSRRALRSKNFRLTYDASFERVIVACAAPRGEDAGTWITESMQQAYIRLHRLGFAHSIEVWSGDRLVGGLYGVGLRRAFFGESMFHLESEASRYALFGLVALLRQRNVLVLDCQQETPHMMRMGAVLLSRRSFESRLVRAGLGAEMGGGPLLPWTERYDWSPESSSWSEKLK